jgi:sugar/nucleoside kinase (ribokinase family)
MSLLVTGSIGIDTVQTPRGRAGNVPGGSAIYFSWAAAMFGKVRLVGVVGDDFPRSFEFCLQHPNIDIRGLERRRGSKTFRWSGRYDATMNEAQTTAVDLNVLAETAPTIPAAFADSAVVFLAATHPGLQIQLLSQVKKPRLVVADTRDLWIKNYGKELIKSLKSVNGLVLNDMEARLLTNKVNLVAALHDIGRLLKKDGPQLVIIKKGEHGCLALYDGALLAMPAYPTAEVVDPTGAGDSFAGGLLGCLAAKKTWSLRSIKESLVAGTVMASFTIADFSLGGLRKATRPQVRKRLETMRTMLNAY